MHTSICVSCLNQSFSLIRYTSPFSILLSPSFHSSTLLILRHPPACHLLLTLVFSWKPTSLLVLLHSVCILLLSYHTDRRPPGTGTYASLPLFLFPSSALPPPHSTSAKNVFSLSSSFFFPFVALPGRLAHPSSLLPPSLPEKSRRATNVIM